MKNRLRIIMAERMLTIKKLSEETGISRTTITNLYYEKSKGISFETLNTLLNYFECGAGDLLYPIKVAKGERL